jgi:hypothetical protein
MTHLGGALLRLAHHEDSDGEREEGHRDSFSRRGQRLSACMCEANDVRHGYSDPSLIFHTFQLERHLQGESLRCHSHFCIRFSAGADDVAAHCPCRRSTQAAGQIVHSERKERSFP